MMKSRQTVAQQSHRRGMAFGARPHGAKRSLSLLAKVKQQRALSGCFLKSGRPIFSGNRGQKERLVRRASCAVVCASRGRGDPDGREELQRVHVPDAAYSLAPSSPSPAINSPCEAGCCSCDYEQDATRHAALRCLLRVTADDIRQRYSAPVSGILAPQRVSNLRIVTKL
jgi:hypothetical protein